MCLSIMGGTVLLAHIVEPIGRPIDFTRMESPGYPEFDILHTGRSVSVEGNTALNGRDTVKADP